MDLKPDNLLLGKDYSLRIIDFDGCCHEKSFKCMMKGSKNFRAPELLINKCSQPKKADIFSAGIILFLWKFQVYPYLEVSPTKKFDLFKLLLDNDEEFWHKQAEINGVACNQEFKKLFM
mmetsp:Transcript_7090/g.6347  ORF Transcript_7090/g.6347 Transcript_7090/m.6347 type:complete len:119 (-) Transcript_7090:905-1261(-)